MEKLNLFKLAEIELQRENKSDYTLADILDKAIAIRKWIDKHSTNVAQAIMDNKVVYQYGNTYQVIN